MLEREKRLVKKEKDKIKEEKEKIREKGKVQPYFLSWIIAFLFVYIWHIFMR